MDVFSIPPGELSHTADSPEGIARFVAEAASCAPSAYDTAPWWFSADDDTICVRADLERELPAIDPGGREMTISCGAAIFTARVAMRYLGLLADVRVFPEPAISNLVARIGWAHERKPPGDFERKLFADVASRRTHHGDFATDRLPAGLMSTLGEEAARENAALRIMGDDDHRTAVLALTQAADCAFRLDGARSAEAAAHGTASSRGWGPGPQAVPAGVNAVPGSPGIVTALTTATDAPRDWVSAGQALQRVLLAAASRDVGVAIHAQPLEFGQLRDFISSELTDGAWPHLVLRFGESPGRHD